MTFFVIVEVLVVAGGWYDLDFGQQISSSELLRVGDTGWTRASPLRSAVRAIRGVSINNQVIMMGEQILALACKAEFFFQNENILLKLNKYFF